jgi:predicted nucleotidyltransferase
MSIAPAIQKLKEMKTELLTQYGISRVRVFDPAVVGEADDANIGILLGYPETPSLLEISELQNRLQTELNSKIILAIEGMIKPGWERRINQGAKDL